MASNDIHIHIQTTADTQGFDKVRTNMAGLEKGLQGVYAATVPLKTAMTIVTRLNWAFGLLTTAISAASAIYNKFSNDSKKGAEDAAEAQKKHKDSIEKAAKAADDLRKQTLDQYRAALDDANRKANVHLTLIRQHITLRKRLADAELAAKISSIQNDGTLTNEQKTVQIAAAKHSALGEQRALQDMDGQALAKSLRSIAEDAFKAMIPLGQKRLSSEVAQTAAQSRLEEDSTALAQLEQRKAYIELLKQRNHDLWEQNLYGDVSIKQWKENEAIIAENSKKIKELSPTLEGETALRKSVKDRQEELNKANETLAKDKSAYDEALKLANKATEEEIAATSSLATEKAYQADIRAQENITLKNETEQAIAAAQKKDTPTAPTTDKYRPIPTRIENAQAIGLGLEDPTQHYQSAGEGLMGGLYETMGQLGTLGDGIANGVFATINDAIGSCTESMMGLIDGTMNWRDALANIGQTLLTTVLQAIMNVFATWMAQMLLQSLLGDSLKKKEAATSVAAEATKAPLLATNAANASIASWGGAAAAGTTAMVAGLIIALGLAAALAASTFAQGGYVSGPGTSTSDSIPALLSNGEYVIPAHAVDNYGTGFLDSIRSNSYNPSQPSYSPAASSANATGASSNGSRVNIAYFSSETAAQKWAESQEGQTTLVDITRANRAEIGIET